jgi:hypothetical protein
MDHWVGGITLALKYAPRWRALVLSSRTAIDLGSDSATPLLMRGAHSLRLRNGPQQNRAAPNQQNPDETVFQDEASHPWGYLTDRERTARWRRRAANSAMRRRGPGSAVAKGSSEIGPSRVVGPLSCVVGPNSQGNGHQLQGLHGKAPVF